MKVLECCALYPDIGIRVLIDKSLVTVSDDRIWMHDLLQEMGREIVKQNSYENPGKRSRVWLYEDIEHVLKQNEGMEEIEGIVLEWEGSERGNLSTKAFPKMKKLRFLIVRNCHSFESVHHLPDDQLKYLEWNDYPSKTLPPSFQPDKLVELNLRHSHIEQLWKSMKAIKPLQNLKLIDLSHCQSLRKTPDFRWFPNVEIVKLERCTRLRKVHDSIGTLRDLFSLNLKDCTNLVDLPSSIGNLKSLKNLILSGCSKLEKLPERLQNLTCLEVLDLGKTAVRQLPPYLKLSKSLQVLSFHGCNEPQRKSWDLVSPFRTLPRNNPSPVTSMLTSLLDFCYLKILDLSNCNLTEGAIPDHLSCFTALGTLNLSGNDFFSLPASIRQLSNLEVLIVDNCKKLESLPELPLGIKYVSMFDCESLTDLPSRPLEAGKPSKQFELVLSNSHKLNQLRGNDGFSYVLDRLYFLLKNWPQGLAVSAVYVVDDDKKLWNEDDDSEFPRIQCFVQPNTEKASSSNHPFTLLLERDAWKPGFDQHWFIYIPERCYEGGVELWNNIDVRFSCRRLTVKKCGVRLVYEQDVEELDPCKSQQHKANNSITFVE
ncbi:hypothetical protein K2173_003851 [Erythroxylum novogranatense]|uniref:Disease resistance protein Roq1-like winged-helix domain-containing protein n=1 Tax=Erythroxylum novogranatense TaxID=1862640 RepID=A0AAV8S400_9ROSI|nr:hypothetical protein K2173_003851 [Erythroxylum novogranatense]